MIKENDWDFMEDIPDILCDIYDIRTCIPKEVLDLPKKNDKTTRTIGNCFGEIIETLEQYRRLVT
tara:strand:+ start:203 stop:397 length:195 start_codon:yes stop_codon:yes gene_type:complete